MATTLREGGYSSCKADPDLWIRPRTKPNGNKYWEFALRYVDEILVISHAPQEVMDFLSSMYTLKEGCVKEPDCYLGADVKKWHIDGSVERCFISLRTLKGMIVRHTEPLFDEQIVVQCDWSEFYPGAAEVEPPNAPELRGNPVTMSCFVDADHAGCRATRRSHTGILIFLNRAPIMWYSKRQNTVESSTFGSEYVAAKTAVKMIEDLRLSNG